MIDTLVARFGPTPVAAMASLIFLLPLAAWAGAVDLVPSPAVWATGAIGVVLIVPWVLVARRAYSAQAALPAGRHRFEWRQMGRSERRWAAGFAAAAIGVVGWLNAAATVDLNALGPGLEAGRAGTFVLVAAALLLLSGLVVLAIWCWRGNGRAFRLRA